MPDTFFGYDYEKGWIAWLFGFGKRKPSGSAIRWGKCEFHNGQYAYIARDYRCKGNDWDGQ